MILSGFHVVHWDEKKIHSQGLNLKHKVLNQELDQVTLKLIVFVRALFTIFGL